MKKIKSKNGITLIALIITIIVLLILAGVSIAMVIGDNGVLSQAGNAKEETEISKEKEQINLAASAAMMDDYNMLEITEENFEEELNSFIGERDVDYTLSKSGYYYIVKYLLSNRSYCVDANTGTISEYIDYSYLFEFDSTTGTILRVKEDYIIDYYSYADGSYSSYFTDQNHGWCKLKEDIDTLFIPSVINGVEVKNINNIGITNVKKVIIEDGIESIKLLFSTTTNNGGPGVGGNYSLEELIIPDSVKSIGSYALYGCTSLKKVVLSDNITEINKYCFYNCKNLEEIIIPDSVKTIGSYALYGCTSLKKVVLPDALTEMEGNVFSNCKKLTTIYIPINLTNITLSTYYTNTDSPFYGCTGLVIYCEAKETPSGWNTYWNYDTTTTQLEVKYGYTREAYEAETK